MNETFAVTRKPPPPLGNTGRPRAPVWDAVRALKVGESVVVKAKKGTNFRSMRVHAWALAQREGTELTSYRNNGSLIIKRLT